MRSTSFRSVVEPRFQEGGRVDAQRDDSPFGVLRENVAAYMGQAIEPQQGQMSDVERAVAGLHAMVRLPPELRQKIQGGRMRRLAVRGGKELVEHTMRELARETGDPGGRVVEYSGGALEWVPNGPGGQPQPTTGETFYDPIAEEQARVQAEAETPGGIWLSDIPAETREAWRTEWEEDKASREVLGQHQLARGGIVRAESERAYQDGGMVNEIIERSTDPTPGENLSQMIIRNRDDAMARLRAGREAIATRRDAQAKRDESSRWLALAQGMLAPTRSGGFGESLGTTAGLMRQEQEMARGHEGERIQEEALLLEQEGQIQDDYIAQLQAQARIEKEGNLGEYSRARPVGTAELYPHPEDPSRLARAQNIWRPNLEVQAKDENGQLMFDEAGEPITVRGGMELQYTDPLGPDGSIPFAVSPLDYERARQLELQRGLGEDLAKRINDDIISGRDAWPVIQKYEMTMDLMREVERSGMGTGGWVALLQGVAEWWGVDTEGVTRLGELRNRLGQAVLEGLQHFPGQISEGERKYMESLESGLGKPLGVNMALLEEGLRLQRARLRRGLRAAREIGSNLDLLAMGIDPNAPPGTAPAGTPQGVQQNVPGSTRANPLEAVPGAPPPAGTWIRLPSGEVMRYPGAPEGELPPQGFQLTQAPAASPGG